jgi:SAM-dependent methyltransferase
MTATEAGYTLDNTWDKAERRVRLIEEIYDEATIAHLVRTGVGPGWRCLELGAGAGSIARWLCDRVGDTGVVTAVDLEPRFLEADPRPNMDIRRHDIVADGIPGGDYGLIHARALLVHLSTRDEALAEIVTKLRPGGVLLLEEPDVSSCAAADSAVYREMFDRILGAVATKGSDWTWSRMLPRKLAEAGLVEVAGTEITHLYNGGAPCAAFWTLTAEQLAPLLETQGTGSDLLGAFTAELADPSRWFPMSKLISAWGRRP